MQAEGSNGSKRVLMVVYPVSGPNRLQIWGFGLKQTLEQYEAPSWRLLHLNNFIC